MAASCFCGGGTLRVDRIVRETYNTTFDENGVMAQPAYVRKERVELQVPSIRLPDIFAVKCASCGSRLSVSPSQRRWNSDAPVEYEIDSLVPFEHHGLWVSPYSPTEQVHMRTMLLLLNWTYRSHQFFCWCPPAPNGDMPASFTLEAAWHTAHAVLWLITPPPGEVIPNIVAG